MIRALIAILALVMSFRAQAKGLKPDKKLILDKIEATALLEGVDPRLMQAIAQTESSLNPKAVGAVGELGLFQMRPEYHKVYRAMTVEQQTKAAIKLIKELKKECGVKFLQCWNMGVAKTRQKNFSRTRYEKKVKYAYQNLLHTRSISSVKGPIIAWQEAK